MKTTRLTLLALCFAAFFSQDAIAQLKVAADGKVGIGTTTPDKKLEVQGVLMVNNNATYPMGKQSNFQMRTFDDPTKSFNFFLAQTDANNNQVIFGGGAGSQYAATNIGFFTAPNTTTVLGTERMRITSTGNIRMNTAGDAGDVSFALNLITGNAAKPSGGEWATFSDSRLKSGVRPFTDGLEQVMQINPVYFHYKKETGYESDKEFVGIIAQEMQKVAPYTVNEVKVQIEGDDKTTRLPETVLSFDGTAVKYMLVNAIQEQQEMIADQATKIEELEAKLLRIEQMLAGNGGTIGTGNPTTNITLEGTDATVLKQNAPNPFNEDTQIEYTLPRSSFNSAYIQISNMQGAVMRRVSLPLEAGPGVLNIKAKELAVGEYVYSLIIDGRVIDTKKMLLVN